MFAVTKTEQSRRGKVLKASIFHTHKHTHTKRVATKFGITEGANGNATLQHFDRVDRWICRWFCKVFDE